jgi:hypothetical protein
MPFINRKIEEAKSKTISLSRNIYQLPGASAKNLSRTLILFYNNEGKDEKGSQNS